MASDDEDHSKPDPGDSRSGAREGQGEVDSGSRNSMSELEDELAALLDDAPLLPEDDDEGSGVDFEPPPRLRQRSLAGSEAPSSPLDTGSRSAHSLAGDEEALVSRETPTQAEALAPGDHESRSTSEGGAEAEPVPVAASTLAVVEAAGQEAGSGAAVAGDAGFDREPGGPVAAVKRAAGVRSPKTAPVSTPEADSEGSGRGLKAVATLLLIVLIVAMGWFSNTGEGSKSMSESAPSAVTDGRQVGAGDVTQPASSPRRAAAQPSVRALAPPSESAALPQLGPGASASAPGQPAAEPGSEATAPPFNPRSALAALAPAGIQASRCRRSRDPAGRVYVKVVIGTGGVIESVFAGPVYKDSETLACIERKLRGAPLPRFSGEGGEVILPVLLK